MVHIIPLTRMLRACRWPGCEAEPIEKQIPLCDRHFEYIGLRYMDARTVMGSSFLREVSPIDEKRERTRRRDEARAQMLEQQSVVYYVRIGDHVKIGFTVNLKQRLSQLRLDPPAVLATEPGGRITEARRHAEFADERVGRREDFNPSRRLLAHIADLRQLHGDPVITTFPKAQ